MSERHGHHAKGRPAESIDAVGPDRETPDRVAILSLHTSPLDQPGTGDSGGMNVYVLSVARRLAEQGVDVDVFTRCAGRGTPDVDRVGERTRIIQVQAGPCASLPKEQLPGVLPDFLDGVVTIAAAEAPQGHRHAPYDVVHSHYWLSGWVGERAKEIWGVPHVASFHTLGRVKNGYRSFADPPEPQVRLDGEQTVVRGVDRILAPTPVEAAELVDLYGADPDRIRIVPPGVDGRVFAPRPKGPARETLGLGDGPVVLFVGRLQPFKGPDVAVVAFAHVLARDPGLGANATLVIVGGSSGNADGTSEVERLRRLAASAGIEDRVRFFPPQSHARLAEFYSAADVLLVPSRAESFGLVALEAQACGTPVVASATGGLRHVVLDGRTGYLVSGHRPDDYADRVLALLGDPVLTARLSAAAVRHAGRFSWEHTAQDTRRVYGELLRGPGGARP